MPRIFSPTIIDGYTQPGSAANTNPIDQADNAVIRIELDGSQAGRPANGLELFAAGCTVAGGLAIHSFITKLQVGTTVNLLLDGVGIFVLADHETIAGNFIGTDATGMVAHGNEVQGIALFSYDNIIGGTNPADRNVISGNGGDGVGTASSQTGNRIIGNFIGTDATGAAALPTNLLTVAGYRLASDGRAPRRLGRHRRRHDSRGAKRHLRQCRRRCRPAPLQQCRPATRAPRWKP